MPLERAGSAEEFADAILWLASAEASYVSGAILPVAGAGVDRYCNIDAGDQNDHWRSTTQSSTSARKSLK